MYTQTNERRRETGHVLWSSGHESGKELPTTTIGMLKLRSVCFLFFCETGSRMDPAIIESIMEPEIPDDVESSSTMHRRAPMAVSNPNVVSVPSLLRLKTSSPTNCWMNSRSLLLPTLDVPMIASPFCHLSKVLRGSRSRPRNARKMRMLSSGLV